MLERNGLITRSSGPSEVLGEGECYIIYQNPGARIPWVTQMLDFGVDMSNVEVVKGHAIGVLKPGDLYVRGETLRIFKPDNTALPAHTQVVPVEASSLVR